MDEIKLDLHQVKRDLLHGIYECSQRGLNHSAKWLSELNYSLSHIKLGSDEILGPNYDCGDESEAFLVSKSYLDLKEYDRCTFFTRNCENPKPRFLHFYSKYLSIEKKKLDNMTDTNCPPDQSENTELTALCTELKSDYYENKLDGYCLYLFGVILRKLDLDLAINVFVKAVNTEPMLWCAWYELGKIIPDKNQMFTIQLPNHWMKHFFLAHAHLEQLNNDESLRIYFELCDQGFKDSTYLMAQIALGHHNRRGKSMTFLFLLNNG